MLTEVPWIDIRFILGKNTPCIFNVIKYVYGTGR